MKILEIKELTKARGQVKNELLAQAQRRVSSQLSSQLWRRGTQAGEIEVEISMLNRFNQIRETQSQRINQFMQDR